MALFSKSESQLPQFFGRRGVISLFRVTSNDKYKSQTCRRQQPLPKFSREYSTLLGQNPKSFIDLTLGELKSLNVHFVGFVNIPGVHMVHPFSNVITGLIQAGGVDSKGTLREIQIIL